MLAVEAPEIPLLTPPASTKPLDGLLAATVGASLAPVMENEKDLLLLALPSVTLTLKASTTVAPADSCCTDVDELFRVYVKMLVDASSTTLP